MGTDGRTPLVRTGMKVPSPYLLYSESDEKIMRKSNYISIECKYYYHEMIMVRRFIECRQKRRVPVLNECASSDHIVFAISGTRTLSARVDGRGPVQFF